MPRTIDQLLSEADEIIEKRASESKTEEPVSEDILKIAEELTHIEDAEEEEVEKVASEVSEPTSILEKVAHSLAIVEVLANLPYLQKVGEFEKAASEKGHSPEEIEAHLEKAASKNYISVAKMIPWLSGE